MAKSYGLKKQISKLNPKMGFIWRAKHGLRKSGFLKDQIGLIWGRTGWGEERRREEEEEEEKKRRSGDQAKKVWKLNSSMDLWNSKDWFS